MHEIALKRIVLELPGMDDVPVRSVEYAEGRTLDVYGRGPALVFVTGFPDAGMMARMGCHLKDMRSYVDWGRLVASSGVAAVTYANRDPADAQLVFDYLRAHGGDLGIDADRLGVMAFSGNGPQGVAMVDARVRCAVFCYAFLYGATAIAKAIGFADATADRTPADYPAGVPTMVVRAGQDEVPMINASIDAFVAASLARDLPLTVVNHAGAKHSFDLFDDSDATRGVIRAILAFVREKL